MAGFFSGIGNRMKNAEGSPPPRQYVEKGGKWLIEITKMSTGESKRSGKKGTEWTAMEFKFLETLNKPNVDLDGPDYKVGDECNWHKYLNSERNTGEMIQLVGAITQEEFKTVQNDPDIPEDVFKDEGASVVGTQLVLTSSRKPKGDKVFYNTSFEFHAEP